MTREEHTNLIREIRLNLGDEGKVAEMLSDLSDAFNAEVSVKETIINENENLKAANESLRESNMKLFLKVGVQTDSETESIRKEEPKKLEFKDLFNEKGEIK